MKKRDWCGLAGFLVAMGTVHSAHATVFTVTDTSDSYVQGDGVCSLREAVDTANWNDCWADCGCGSADEVDDVELTYGETYTLDNVLYIWDEMVLDGNWAVVRGSDGGGDFSGLRVQSSYVQLDALVLENFRHAALVIDENATASTWRLEVRNNMFNIGSGQNSSIILLGGAYLYLYGGNIHHNVYNIKGGGIFISANAWVDLDGTVIAYNEVSQYGGGVHNQGHFHCYGGSLIYGNSAVYGGGGLYNTSSGVFDGPSGACHILGNTSTSGGADIGGHS